MEISQCRAHFNTLWNENATCSADGAGCSNEPLDRADSVRVTCCWAKLVSVTCHREIARTMMSSMMDEEENEKEEEDREPAVIREPDEDE